MTESAIFSRLIKIGNSKGVRLPKTLLEASGITGPIEILLGKGQIIIRPVLSQARREGWSKSFQEMAANNDDQLLDMEIETSWDELEWEW